MVESAWKTFNETRPKAAPKPRKKREVGMKLDTITMDPSEAREKFLEYRRSVRERHDAEDAAIMKGYRALSQGHQLIKLADTLAAGGLDEKDRPRLAIVRSDAKWCWMRNSQSRGLQFTEDNDFWRSRHASRITVRDQRLFPRPCHNPHHTYHQPGAQSCTEVQGKALVPIVPPSLRPAAKLSNYVTLFEAEWLPTPPRDPALLKHLGGDLYLVLAVWNLTDLERAVLAGRFTD